MHCKNTAPMNVVATVAMQMKSENACLNLTSFGIIMTVNVDVENILQMDAQQVSTLIQTLARKYSI